MENGLLYILAFSAMAIALFACVLPGTSNLDLALAYSSFTIDYNHSVPFNYTAKRYDGVTFSSLTNLTVVLQNCVDNLNSASTGGTIHFLKGTYILNGTVTVSSANKGIRFSGESIGWLYAPSMGTVIKASQGWKSNAYMFDTLAQWAWFDNIGLNGNNSANGLHLGAPDQRVTNCAISYCVVGIEIISSNAWIQNNWIEYCTTYGVHSDTSEDVWIQDNMFYANGNMDVATSTGSFGAKDQVWIQNNRFYGSIRAIDTWGSLNNLMILNNKFYGCTSAGIRFEDDVSFVNIQGNVLEGDSVTDNFIKIESGVTIAKMNVLSNSIVGNTSIAINNLGTITTLNSAYNFGV